MSFWSLFVASLLGSPHCVGMCGGLVGMVSGLGERTRAPRSIPLVLYHSGRIATYAVLGALAARFGHSLDQLGAWVGIRRFAPLIVAIFLFGQAFAVLFEKRWPLPRLLARLNVRWTPIVSRAQGVWKFPVLGALTALLPCGWLYGFVVLAMGFPAAGTGAIALLVFGLGTLPALALLGEGLRRAVRRTGLGASTVTAVLLVIAGMVSLAQHLGYVPNFIPGLSGHSSIGGHACSAS